jgi:hypothetical protein
MARYKTPKADKFDITEWQKSVKKSVNENSSDREWEVYVADDSYGKNEKVVKSGASKRSAVILYNKLIKSDKYFAVGMRVVNESVNESVSPAKAADVMFGKLAASKLIGKQNKKAATNLLTYMIARRNFKVSDPRIVAGYLVQDLAGAKLIDMKNGNRAIQVIANLVSSMKLESVDENKGLWANIRAKKARGEKPAKPGDEDYPDKKNWDDNTKEGIEEAKPDLAGMMKMAAKAASITKQTRQVGKSYLQSLAKDLKRNAKDYVDYDQDDWVEDLENWIADRS